MSRFNDFSRYDALGLAELVRRKSVSPAELVDAAIERIERVNPALNAVVTRLYEDARGRALGTLPEGPFRGVPFLMKDLLSAVAGVPLMSGSRFFRDYVPAYDAELVRRYRAAGLVIVGKTNTPEFGLIPVTEPELHGPTHSPWRLGTTAGGSSGGSAAAVAAGVVPMAHGGDGGGSIRIPAACCGAFGFKPSRGRTPSGPDASEYWQGLVCEHALTRSVRDSAALLDATSAPERTAPYAAPAPERPFASEVGAPPGRLRIGFTSQPFLPAKVAPECVAAVRDAAQLCEELGHDVAEAAPVIDAREFARSFFTVVCAETAADIRMAERRLGRRGRPQDFEAGTWLAAMLGRQLTGEDVAMARRDLMAVGRRAAAFFENWDVLLTPTLGSPPLAIGALKPRGLEAQAQHLIADRNLGRVLKWMGGVDRVVDKVFEFIPFTPLANVAGQPSMSVPLYWDREKLPVGVMFTAALGAEGTLFRLAGQLEQARPWAMRRPPVHAFDA